MATAQDVTPEHHVESEQRVTPLELFFDLVFVFALTQVTSLLADDPTWEGLLRGGAVMAALWWAWAAYAWLTDEIDHDEGANRLAMLVSMAAMLIVALAVPQAFGDDAVVFGLAYLVVRLMHLVLFIVGTPDVHVRAAMITLSRTSVPAPVLLVVAAFLDGAAQGAVWALALAIDYAGPYVFGVRGLRISPGHFAERFGLIVIIALGESIVAIGVGAAGLELDAGVLIAAVLAIAASASLWWAYFDVAALLAERNLRAARGDAQPELARDAYAYMHLPLITGIILLALGIKKTIEHVDVPLDDVPAIALCGGVALYLGAHVAFGLRTKGTVSGTRLAAALACLALIPLAMNVDAIVALGVVSAVTCALIVSEAIVYREARTRARAAPH
jgi:low temperature requirement protein LtrA